MATNYTAKTQPKITVQKQCSETLSFCPVQKSGKIMADVAGWVNSLQYHVVNGAGKQCSLGWVPRQHYQNIRILLYFFFPLL